MCVNIENTYSAVYAAAAQTNAGTHLRSSWVHTSCDVGFFFWICASDSVKQLAQW